MSAPGRAWSGGKVLGPGGCPVLEEGAWSQGAALGGCLVPGGMPGLGPCLVPGGVGIPACTVADPSGETATAADGTHPTGMHSCSFFILEIDFDI